MLYVPSSYIKSLGCLAVSLFVRSLRHSKHSLSASAQSLTSHQRNPSALLRLLSATLPRQRAGYSPPALEATSLDVERALYYTVPLRGFKIRYVTCEPSAFNARVLGVVDGCFLES